MDRSLRGLSVVIGSMHGTAAIPEPEVIDDSDDDNDEDMLYEAVTEIMGAGGIDKVTPFLSAFASGFGGDKDKASKDAQEQRDKLVKLERDKAEAEAKSRRMLWIVLGIVGVGVLGTGVYFTMRKSK
jgi:hypothetical protein